MVVVAVVMTVFVTAVMTMLVATTRDSWRYILGYEQRTGVDYVSGGQSSKETDPTYLTEFGTHSHWLQPWRSYLETVPASVFVNGPGMNASNLSADPGLVMNMLGHHGVRHVRIEEGWGNIDYADETALDNADDFRRYLLAAKAADVRPLIVLNSNDGLPAPARSTDHVVPNGARAGDASLEFDSTSGLVPGYSGLDRLSTTMAPELLITAINGNMVTLSKPLPTSLAVGARVGFTTLKYRPIAEPDSSDYQTTLAGWRRYVMTVASFAATALGTDGRADVGFDLEVWNELTFGSAFLDINNYYAGNRFATRLDRTLADIMQATAAEATANPAAFTGTVISDGFANTIPWPAAAAEPARVGAISKHPYSTRKYFPGNDQNTVAVNALRQRDSSFAPTYSALFPEYAGTEIQTETMVRDMGPITNDVYGAPSHGRYARKINGEMAPVTTWITEVNEAPSEDNPSISRQQALALKAKTTARYLAFYLNKGVTQLDFFSAEGGDTGIGMVQENFLALAAKASATYPIDDALYTSPALAVMKEMSSIMSNGLDPDLSLATTRPLTIASVADTHNHAQFIGDGSAAHPPLYDRELLAILPFEVNPRKFVVPYYVITRDVTKSLGTEQFTVRLRGVHGVTATVRSEDPITRRPVKVGIVQRESNGLTIRLTATDYPYMLILDHA